jgi:hypothetical protein
MAFGMLQVHASEAWIGRNRPTSGRRRTFLNVLKIFSFVLATSILMITIASMVAQPKVPFGLFVGTTFMFGAAVYVFVAENFLQWAAPLLNRRRPGKWIKELEYPYLMLGTIGVFVAINRIDIVEGMGRSLDLWGPMLIASAIAVKLIKVRAETNDWDKL